MPRKKLTARFVETVKPKTTRVEYHDVKTPGLTLRVSPEGKKTWCLLYRCAGSRTLKRLPLGTFEPVTLKQARDDAEEARRTVQKGGDPLVDRRAAIAAREAAAVAKDTIADLATDYLEKHAKPYKRSWREDQRVLDNVILPRWKTTKVRDLTRRDVRALVDEIASHAPVSANRTLALVSTMLNYGIEHDWCDANVAARLKPLPEQSRARVLDENEIRDVFAAIDAKTGSGSIRTTMRPDIATAYKVRAWTAQRGAEVFRMRWEDLELGKTDGWWTIPPQFTKNKEEHRVPLTEPVVRLLHASRATAKAGAIYVFPARAKAPAVEAGKRATTLLATYLRAKWNPKPDNGDDLPAADDGASATDLRDFRGHDLRRTAASYMAAAGVAPGTISRVLNHVEGGPRATQVYNRYSFDGEKRSAMEVWTRTLTRILAGKPAVDRKVVTFKRAQRAR